MFDLLLRKNSFKMVFYSDESILSKSGMFVEKMYLCDDLFKMNNITIVTNDENKIKNVFFFLFALVL